MQHTHVNAITNSQLFEYNGWEEESQFFTCADTNQTLHWIIQCGSHFLYWGFPLEEKISRITTATELATAAEKAKPKQTLPPEFTVYASVFSKEATNHVLPPRPYDHEINLDDSFTPKIGKVYPLFPEERKATEDFLQENLNCGKIHPLNSPQASPFFFVKKKDGGLRPYQDYCYLNEHTTWDAYPLLLISDLIDKLKDAKLFTKFGVRWGYNNVHMYQRWPPVEGRLHHT